MANRNKIKQKHSQNRKSSWRNPIFKKKDGSFNFEEETEEDEEAFVGRKERQIERIEKKKKIKERRREKRRIEEEDE